ncbi:MAG: polyhydroxyalkanoate depolymerase, partial [Planctomycetes bacterium]|nr:polyhydroxyalkanoate depolymerase [Planctomycetota bacterium]
SDTAGKVVFEGSAKGERFDANDHVTVSLSLGQEYQVAIRYRDRASEATIQVDKRDTPFTFILAPPAEKSKARIDENASRAAVESLEKHLASEPAKRQPLGEEAFAAIPLTREDATRAEELLWQDHVRRIRDTRAEEMKARELTDGDLKMPFYYKIFGDKPEGGRSMYISLHGGGGAPKRVNDGQWENQKRLYQLEEGVYVVPRAPTDTWNLWHQGHIDRLFGRLIENMIVFEDVDPNRVYIMGYSAGGDGVFQLAPRMADRWAGAAMMAGHPNETSPLGLRNMAFTIHVGGRDAAYNRNKIAADWQQKLADLRKADPEGYVHWVKIYADKGHWLDREDAAAIPWMAKVRRDPLPARIVWKQDDVTHARFYWLAVEPNSTEARAEVTANRTGQKIDIQANGVQCLTIRLNDQLLNLDEPISITSDGKPLFRGHATRTIAVLAKTLGEYGDPKAVYSGELTVDLPRPIEAKR